MSDHILGRLIPASSNTNIETKQKLSLTKINPDIKLFYPVLRLLIVKHLGGKALDCKFELELQEALEKFFK